MLVLFLAYILCVSASDWYLSGVTLSYYSSGTQLTTNNGVTYEIDSSGYIFTLNNNYSYETITFTDSDLPNYKERTFTTSEVLTKLKTLNIKMSSYGIITLKGFKCSEILHVYITVPSKVKSSAIYLYVDADMTIKFSKNCISKDLACLSKQKPLPLYQQQLL